MVIDSMVFRNSRVFRKKQKQDYSNVWLEAIHNKFLRNIFWFRKNPHWRSAPDYTNNPSYRNYNYYFLCDRHTSSTAVDVIAYANMNNLGTTIGYPTDACKKGYSNLYKFRLPNSKLRAYVFTLSYAYSDTTGKSEFIEPKTILCEDEIDRCVEENIINGKLNLNYVGKNNPVYLLCQP